ncbi:MAG: DNA mismatch repair endonuclease MutL [Aquificaceae bacterium]|nr:DNA mismatch repair endonuclease MutL [Aquificaceae bacterium]
MRVNLLPEEVRSHIASGEVIEGPAECLKELLENSLDAEATRVEVEIVKGGKRFIGVRDNGMGIPAEDLPKALLGGATSKIRTLEDLQNLHTYGYRGEALHAISLVSRMVIRSRFYQEEVGREVRVEGGKVTSQRAVGMQVGTHVEVYDLFYNLPLRKAFLGKEDRERRRIYHIFKALALANPSVFFRLEAEGREVFRLKPGDIRERAEEVFEERMEHLSFEEKPFRVDLLLSLGNTRKVPFLFVNRRPVHNKELIEYLRKSVGRWGLCICHINMPPYLLDVNVHPKKTEVRLMKESKIREIIREALRNRHSLRPPSLSQERAVYAQDPEFVGIIDNTLIVAKYGDYLYFFDQHLLSERYNYEMGMSAEEACGMSFKAGDRLGRELARELLRRWLHFKNREVCPHGRPIYYRIYLGELYRKLGREY